MVGTYKEKRSGGEWWQRSGEGVADFDYGRQVGNDFRKEVARILTRDGEYRMVALPSFWRVNHSVGWSTCTELMGIRWRVLEAVTWKDANRY